MATTQQTGAVAAVPRPQPLVVYFPYDFPVKSMLADAQRYRKSTYEQAKNSSAERIVVLSDERYVAEHYDELRAPTLRVLAIGTERFKDPRLDAVAYAYLPPETPVDLLERMVDNAIDHIHLLATRREANDRLAGVTREIQQLNQVGAALSAEHDTGKLLDLILLKCREITNSDAGSLYLVEHEEGEAKYDEAQLARLAGDETGKFILKDQPAPPRKLRFKLAHNDTVQVPFREFVMEISEKSVAGYVALTGEPVNIEDAYHLPEGVPYGFKRKFDEDSGYRTKSILAVPMRNQKDEIVGVVQLINAKREFKARLDSLSAVRDQVVTFSLRQQEIVQSLASQAAVALENSRLYAAIQALFEGFVKASVSAIEARDPTTSGHSFRVANLTVGMAEAVDRVESGPYAGMHFTRNEMKEIRYASLLHDFGKVGVREEVLVKAKKLYPSQIDLIRERFKYVQRSIEAEALRSRVDYMLQKGRDEFLQKQEKFDQELANQLTELDRFLKTVVDANEPTVMPEGSFDTLLDIAAKQYLDVDGSGRTLLNEDEVRLLSIRKGSLDDEERKQIESHVVHSYNFLQQIPWTKEIRNIPLIARGHHEKLNGKGYPYKLASKDIPVQTRMMTISDIFDALAASDRPYKKAVSLERALQILEFSVKDGELDPNLFSIFLEAKVFEKWKVEPFAY
jgi:HD-GYP domain-containing protein (c-di-GMP phosphodiesterase class II)